VLDVAAPFSFGVSAAGTRQLPPNVVFDPPEIIDASPDGAIAQSPADSLALARWDQATGKYVWNGDGALQLPVRELRVQRASIGQVSVDFGARASGVLI